MLLKSSWSVSSLGCIIPGPRAPLCRSLNDYLAFAVNSLHFLSIPLNYGDQSQPQLSVTAQIRAKQCSNYLMIQTCFSFATVLCLHFFLIIRTAGLWQFLPVNWLSTKAILSIFQPTAFEWLTPCLWICSLFSSKCTTLNFSLLNSIRSMSCYSSWPALPSMTTLACRNPGIFSFCGTSGFVFSAAYFLCVFLLISALD